MPGAPPLAKPSFFTGPNDDLAVANAYTQQGGVINAIKDQLSDWGISIPDVLKGGKALASLLPIVTGLKNGNLSLSSTSLITRLLASSEQITAAFKFLGPEAQADLMAGLKTIGPVAVTLGNFTQQIKTTNFNNLNSIGNLINSFTNGAANLGIVDKDSIASIVGGIVKQAGGYGISGTYGAVMAGIHDVEIITKAAGLSLPSVIANGDVASLKQIATSLGPGAIDLIRPSSLASFTQAFNRLTNAGGITLNAPAFDTSTFSNVMDAFNAANPSWNVCTRQGATFGDITSLTNASSDFTTMVSNGIKRLTPGDTQQDYALASLYGPQSVDDSIASMFPNVVQTQGSNSPKVTGTSDPQSKGLLDTLASFMPGLSFAKGGAEAQARIDSTNRYYAAMREIKNGTYDPTKYGLPANVSTTTLSPLAAGTTITSSGVDVTTVTNAFGQKIQRGTHTLLGYNSNGQAIYADDPSAGNDTLFPTPTSARDYLASNTTIN